MFDKNSVYFRQAELLLRVLPLVEKERCFAVKGGTAINFFVRDLPRLSVDIDLTYLPIEPRDKTLTGIGEALERIARDIERVFKGSKVMGLKPRGMNTATKLIVSHRGVQIKLEPNLVLRGSVYPTREIPLMARAMIHFELEVTVRTLSLADLYGGKICACFDRQLPRDAYDVKLLLDHEGITEDIRKAFLVYLISSDRPIHELLSPRFKDMSETYRREFVGMTIDSVPVEDLDRARQRCLELIRGSLTNDERIFLVSFKQGEPHWDLLGLPDIDRFPAIQWKLLNISKMLPGKHQSDFEALKKVLEF